MQSAECGMKTLEFLMFDFGFKIPQSEFRNPQLGWIFPVLDNYLIDACQFLQLHVDGILPGRF